MSTTAFQYRGFTMDLKYPSDWRPRHWFWWLVPPRLDISISCDRLYAPCLGCFNALEADLRRRLRTRPKIVQIDLDGDLKVVTNFTVRLRKRQNKAHVVRRLVQARIDDCRWRHR